MMAGEKHQIPTDPVTGLSYPFIILQPPERAGDLWHDDHHLEFEHMDPALRGLAGRAVRKSVVQNMTRWQHLLIHEKGSAPELPKTEDDKFRATAFGVARLMGPYAIDISREDWWNPVETTPDEYALMTGPRHMYPEHGHRPHRANSVRDDIGRFFASYVVHRDLGHVQPTIRQFLSTKDPARKKELGNQLLVESIEVATEPLRPLQEEVLSLRPINRKVDTLRRAVRRFFVRERFHDYYGTLTQHVVQWA